MSKLLKLLDWVTVPEAAKHLSVIVGDEVSESTVLRLALDRRITLSANFVNHVPMLKGTVVPRIWGEAQVSSEDPYGVHLGPLLDEGRGLLLSNQVVWVTGVFDLPMIGGEAKHVEQRCHQLMGGPEVHAPFFLDLYLQRDEIFFQLRDRSTFESYLDRKPVEPHDSAENYELARCLPEDSALVVRTDELARFQADLASDDKITPVTVSRMDPRSETTYQHIIGSLLELMLGRTRADQPQSVFESQAHIITVLGACRAFPPTPSGRRL